MSIYLVIPKVSLDPLIPRHLVIPYNYSNLQMLGSARAALAERLDLKLRLSLRSFVRRKATETNEGKNKITFNVGGTKQTYDVIDVGVEGKKYYNSFRSLEGQKRVGRLWIGASMLAVIYQLAPHTLARGTVRDLYQSYTKGLSTPVTQDMRRLVTEVLQDMELGAMAAELDVFVATMDEPAGWGEALGGALLGYPASFHLAHPGEVRLDQMRFGGGLSKSEYLTRAQMELPEARLFCDSMVLPEDAKKFALATELARMAKLPHYFLGALHATFVLLTYNAARVVNRKLGMFDKGRRPLQRGIFYFAIGTTMAFTYLICKDFFMRAYERTAVRAAAGVSPQYARGGEIYYQQVLLRNRCIARFEVGGFSKYKADGELATGIFRQKSVPIGQLKAICTEAQTGRD